MRRHLIAAFLTLTLQAQANPLKGVARFLTNGLFYAVASSDASEKTSTKAQELLSHLNPSQNLLAVRKFNKLGRLLFGENNTVTIPYLNYVMLDDNIATLPEQEQRFVLGRSMTILSHKHRYTAMKYLIPYASFALYEQQTTSEQQYSHTNFTNRLFSIPILYLRKLLGKKDPQRAFDGIYALPQKALQLAKPLGIAIIGTLISRYLSRHLESDLDQLTAQNFSCAEGGIKYLSRCYWQGQETDSLFSFIIKQHLAPWYFRNYIRPDLFYYLPLLQELEKVRSIKDITVLHPPRIELLPQKLVSLAPGKAYSNTLSLPHLMLAFVPFATQLLKEFPSYNDRIDNLQKQ